VRVVALPAMLVDAMKRHLAEFPAVDEGLVFRGPLGSQQLIDRFAGHRALCRRVFRPDSTSTIYATPATTWRRQAVPAPELMHRMGHGTMRAALIYQDATGERDREIADALQFRIERELKEMGPIEGPGLAVDGSSSGLAPKGRGR
jgi:hypothetical protein